MSKRSLKNKVYPHKRVRNVTVYLDNTYQIIHQNHSIVEIAQWIVEYIWIKHLKRLSKIINAIYDNTLIYFSTLFIIKNFTNSEEKKKCAAEAQTRAV